MTDQDHSRITNRWLVYGKVSSTDRKLLEAGRSLGTPLGPLLTKAVKAKVDHLVVDAKAAAKAPLKIHTQRIRQLREFCKSPLGAAVVTPV
jgi:hypothetical protein